MKLFIILTLFLFISCGTDEGPQGSSGESGKSCTVEDHPEGAVIRCEDGSEQIVYDGESGPAGEDGINGVDGSDYIEPIFLEGFYQLPYGGYIELITLDDGRTMIYGTQRVYTKNFDEALALHPNITTAPYITRNGKLIIEQTVNYDATTNDVEEDGSTSNITGPRKSIFTFSLNDSSQLEINIKIFSTSGLEIEVDRTVRSI